MKNVNYFYLQFKQIKYIISNNSYNVGILILLYRLQKIVINNFFVQQ